MIETVKPETAEGVAELVRWAADHQSPLEIRGAGTKYGFGNPVEAAHRLDLTGLNGISLYEPEELVLSAAAGTPLALVQATLDQRRQQLAFEPMDLGPLLGGQADAQTLGGVLACNLSGPRRIRAGAARDHFLGFEGVSGRGAPFKSGGRVVKNVTGYDLCKLIAGSHGTLAALTQVTVKVGPAGERTRTLLLAAQAPDQAALAMARAAGSAHDVSALAYLPAAIAARSGVSYVAGARAAMTAVRVEGTAISAETRCAALRELWRGFGEIEELHSHNSIAFWREVRDVAGLLPARDDLIWKLSVTPGEGPALAAALGSKLGGEAYCDWAGGLIWLALPPAEDGHHDAVRAQVAGRGHATLIRAPEEVRRRVAVFQPQERALAALNRQVKQAFDPLNILNPGRMVAGNQG